MPAPQGFLFVNKTAKSTSLSNNRTADLAYEHINRQAQLVAKNRDRKPKGRPVRGTASSLVGWVQTPSPKSSEPSTPPSPPIEDTPETVIRDEDASGNDQYDFGSPASSFDSICSAVVALDKTKQHVIEYFTNVWMPSKDHIPPGCQITGMTPVRPHDWKIAFQVVQGAFQTNDEVSMYALLTAGSRRMQVLHSTTLPRAEFPDLYTVKTIHALRRRIEKGEGGSERLVLDLSFLILAELFTPSPARSELYWRMIRTLIIECGGIGCLSPFTAQIAMGFDHQISAGTLSKPALDPFAYPALLGIKDSGQGPHQETQQLVVALLSQLDPRLRLIALEANALTELVEAMSQFPVEAVAGIRGVIRADVKQLYGTIPEPLRRTDGSQESAAEQNNANVVIADSIYLHIRISTWRTWVWYSALSFLPLSSDTVSFQAPRIVSSEISQTWKSLGIVQRLLEGTGWMMRHDLVFWIASVGFFGATSEHDRGGYRRQLRNAARLVEIASPARLTEVLANHFPLALMHSAAHEQLWRVMKYHEELS